MLAAGRGERFGDATKQLAEIDGDPLVTIVTATAVTAGLSPVLVVVGHDADAVAGAVPAGARTIHNPDFADGQASSLRVGLDALADSRSTSTVVLLADEPGVRVSAVRRVADELRSGAELVRCRYGDRPGHPVGLARARWREAAAADGADAGARALLRGDDVVTVEIDSPAPVDVDTPGDLPT